MADKSFGRRHRLRGRSNFLNILRGEGSKRISGRHCWVAWLDTQEKETRFGIIISSKTCNAVRRNRIKRKIREFLRTNKQLWPSGRMVVIGLNGPLAAEATLMAEIEQMLRKLR